MFDVSSDEIALLNDVDLRELVGRLCEAELERRGLSPSAVTWGGSQTAADGGLDVRVALNPSAEIDGFVARSSTGFQVKTPDMPKSKILEEMRPDGKIRAVIQALANEGGSYVIVSSHGSTADARLTERKNAMRNALADVANASQLHTDFFDRTRLASWVRFYPGITAWVKQRLGRGHSSWRPFGPWSNAAAGVGEEYLVDERLRLYWGDERDASERSMVDALDELRRAIANPRSVVRLVGLSGVGKTRLVQALFDRRIGVNPLPPSLAIYTDLSDNPSPQPIGLSSDLIASQMRAIVVVDNCPPDLHRRLAEVCRANNSSVSVITVEYDVRDDQPESTQVLTLDTSSDELIEELVIRRHQHLSRVNVRTIAQASGGNARIAMALADTVQHSERIVGLSDAELFKRLFQQRNEPNNDLLRAAEACSLVYSFQGEDVTSANAELSLLARLASQTVTDLFSHVSELLRRNLVQQRGVWRAVLPHAVANRLAANALQNIPAGFIEQTFLKDGQERLATSFSKRLSFLHDQRQAVSFAERWLAPDGILGNVTRHNLVQKRMFLNVASVSPAATLAALERAVFNEPSGGIGTVRGYRWLLRSLAYDPHLFDRSVNLLSKGVELATADSHVKDFSDAFAALFTLKLSGTHAPIEQRLSIIDRLLRSSEPRLWKLAFLALSKALETRFTSAGRFDFGGRSRDYGYQPSSEVEGANWYRAVLDLVANFAIKEQVHTVELKKVFARSMRGLWATELVGDQLEGIILLLHERDYWPATWRACLASLRYDGNRLSTKEKSRLVSLLQKIKPADLLQRAKSVIANEDWGVMDLDEIDGELANVDRFQRLETFRFETGVAVAADPLVLQALAPDLFGEGGGVWVLGKGLAQGAIEPRAVWDLLVDEFASLAPADRDIRVCCGFLEQLWRRDRELAQELLDHALAHEAFAPVFPMLQGSVRLDPLGITRLKQALCEGHAPIAAYRSLAYGDVTADLSGAELQDLILAIAKHDDVGFDIAAEILFLRFELLDPTEVEDPGLVSAGRALLRNVKFSDQESLDRHLAGVARRCLKGSSGAEVARQVAMRLHAAVVKHETYGFNSSELLTELLSVHPIVVLDAFFEGARDSESALNIFDYVGDAQGNPTDAVPVDSLIAWCQVKRETRYPIAAKFVNFSVEVDGILNWSNHAIALFSHSVDPRKIIDIFINRFRPSIWSGSLAAEVEKKVRLLDEIPSINSPELFHHIRVAKTRLLQEVVLLRDEETAEDSAQDETFE